MAQGLHTTACYKFSHRFALRAIAPPALRMALQQSCCRVLLLGLPGWHVLQPVFLSSETQLVTQLVTKLVTKPSITWIVLSQRAARAALWVTNNTVVPCS